MRSKAAPLLSRSAADPEDHYVRLLCLRRCRRSPHNVGRSSDFGILVLVSDGKLAEPQYSNKASDRLKWDTVVSTPVAADRARCEKVRAAKLRRAAVPVFGQVAQERQAMRGEGRGSSGLVAEWDKRPQRHGGRNAACLSQSREIATRLSSSNRWALLCCLSKCSLAILKSRRKRCTG